MNKGLRKIAFIIGLGILGVSIFWSQDGFNFDIAGNAGYGKLALYIGWFLAIAFSVLQFVFSSNFRELNMSLILLGLLAYAYSIYTNFKGITHFQGTDPNPIWSWTLAFFLDATAEPLIAWSLGVSREGDFLGNIVKTVSAFFNGIFETARSEDRRKDDTRPNLRVQHGNNGKNGEKQDILPMFERRLSKNSGKRVNYEAIQNLHGVKHTEKPQETRSRNYFDE